MRPTKPTTLDVQSKDLQSKDLQSKDLQSKDLQSNFQFYAPDFQPRNAEESIASLREENEMLRRMAAILERQTQIMRAAWDKPKLR